MYTFESGESIKKPIDPKAEKAHPKKPTPRGEDDGYTFTHHVDTFGDHHPTTEETPPADRL